MICGLFHRASHVVLRREGDNSVLACAKCEELWGMPRMQEPARFARQAVISASVENPYDLSDWSAIRDGYDPGEPDGDGGHDGGDPVGRGETKWEAIRDLLDLEAA